MKLSDQQVDFIFITQRPAFKNMIKDLLKADSFSKWCIALIYIVIVLNKHKITVKQYQRLTSAISVLCSFSDLKYGEINREANIQ